MKNMLKVIASIACALALAACGGSGSNTDTTPATPQPTFSFLPEVVVGSGEEAKVGDLVTMHYTGWLYDAGKPGGKGAKFESSLDGPNNDGKGNPYAFTLGKGAVIVGWDQGIVGMKVGGKRTLTIPADMAYGARGVAKPAPAVSIPPNAALVFDVELVAVKH